VPYPNEHACRLKDPDIWKVVGSITRGNPPIRILIAKKNGQGSSEAQAYRYPKDKWDADKARKHCEDAGGKFEAASGE